MGCGGTKPTTTSVQPKQQQSPNEAGADQNQEGLTSASHRSATHSVASSVHSRRSSKNGKEPSIRSRTPVDVMGNPSPAHNNVSPANDDAESTPSRPATHLSSKSNEHKHSTSAVELDNKSARKNTQSPVSFLNATSEKSKIRSSTRNSSVTPLPHIDRDETGSISKFCAPRDEKASHDHAFRCRYCRHCRKLGSGRIRSAPKLKWIIENPALNEFVIEMDNYDLDAVTKNIITENGHFPGCYDYRPYLTMDELNYTNNVQNDSDYYKLPFITRKTSHITVAHTPFPEYDYLQRHDQRPNKPYDLSLFAD